MIIKGARWEQKIKKETPVEKKPEVIKKAEKKVVKEVPKKETTVVEEKNELDELLSKLDKENK